MNDYWRLGFDLELPLGDAGCVGRELGEGV